MLHVKKKISERGGGGQKCNKVLKANMTHKHTEWEAMWSSKSENFIKMPFLELEHSALHCGSASKEKAN
jgi:hypothetical protein